MTALTSIAACSAEERVTAARCQVHLTRTVFALLLAHDNKDDSSASLERQTPFLQCANPALHPWESDWREGNHGKNHEWTSKPCEKGYRRAWVYTGSTFMPVKTRGQRSLTYLFGIPWPSFRKWPSIVSIWGGTSKQSLAFAGPRIKPLSLSGHECQRWVGKGDAFASEMFVWIVWSWFELVSK